MPTVSIVIPTYNRAAWLDVSVGSVLRQSFPDWECLIVDDRSTDDTAARVAALREQDSRIRYVRNEHLQGPSGARNQGIEASTGRYVAFLDSDDEWEPHHLAECVRHLDEFGEQIAVISGGEVIRIRGSEGPARPHPIEFQSVPTHRLGDSIVFESEGLFEAALEGQTLLRTPSIVARREVFQILRWDEDVRGAEDSLFAMELAYHHIPIAHLPAHHVTVWYHAENTTNCLGQHSPEKATAVRHLFEACQLAILKKFELTPSQQRLRRQRLAEFYVWSLGYNSYQVMGDYGNARRYFKKGISLRPWHLPYWRTLAASYAKQVVRFRRTKSHV